MMRPRTLLCQLLLLLALQGTARAAPARFALVLGNNRGQDPARALRFAESDATKFAEVLVEVGGFDRSQVHVLLGKQAPEVWRTLQAIEQSARRATAPDGQRALLLLYFSGHADGDSLELGQTTLTFRRLSDFLKGSGVDVRLAFVDACHSGQLVGLKGGRRGPGYNIRVEEALESSGFAVVTSSTSGELSQESAEVRGSYFTHYLVSGLRGAADASHDGQITLTEAYRFAYAQTVARTSGSVSGPQHPMYAFALAGRGDVVLTSIKHAPGIIQVESSARGRVYLMSPKSDQVIAEYPLGSAQKSVRLAAAPGRYVAYLVSPGRTERCDLELEAGREQSIGDGRCERVVLADAVHKGGLFQTRATEPRYELGAAFRVERSILDGAGPSYGSAIHAARRLTTAIVALGELSFSSDPGAADRDGYHQIGALLGLGYEQRLGNSFVVTGRAWAGYEHFLQHSGGELRHTSGFAYRGLAGLGLVMHPLVVRLEGGVGARLFRTEESGTRHQLDWLTQLGIGYLFH